LSGPSPDGFARLQSILDYMEESKTSFLWSLYYLGGNLTVIFKEPEYYWYLVDRLDPVNAGLLMVWRSRYMLSGELPDPVVWVHQEMIDRRLITDD
jgi:hypothetical protein